MNRKYWLRQIARASLERFPAKWKPVRVKKTRQIKNLEPRSDSIGTEKALVQRAHQVISLAQIAGSFGGCKFRPGRYQQVARFGTSGRALAGADQARDADRRAQFPTDRPE